ncbi:MAG: glycosyltransferase N-terminal domain-containing protein [bacterium]
MIFNLLDMRSRLCFNKIKRPHGKFIWIHGASVGEVNILTILLPALKNKYPEYKYIISSTTHNGLEQIRRLKVNSIEFTFIIPLDLVLLWNRLIKKLNPDVFIILETELWPSMLFSLRRNHIPYYLLNGRLNISSAKYYRLFGFIFGKGLQSFNGLAVQNSEYKKRFQQTGVPEKAICITGNIKEAFNPIIPKKEWINNERHKHGFSIDSYIIIAGSTRDGEEEIILDAYVSINQTIGSCVLILAPRHLNRLEEVTSLVQKTDFSFALFSQPDKTGRQIILLDRMGQLKNLYSIADISFVGGSLKPFGGHNLLEPLAFGIPVLFGPFTESQKASRQLILENEFGSIVNNSKEFNEAVIRFYYRPHEKNRMARRLTCVFADKIKILDKTVEILPDFA